MKKIYNLDFSYVKILKIQVIIDMLYVVNDWLSILWLYFYCVTNAVRAFLHILSSL
jgi:hypothetical protein